MASEKKIKFLTPESLVGIVDLISSIEYENQEEIPDYDAEQEAIDKYFSIIEMSKTDYYPDLFSKATYIFLNINRHIFSNGNKRLATTSLIVFLNENNFSIREMSKKDYRQSLSKHFGEQEMEDWEGFSSIEFVMYNFAIITALQNKQGISFEETKKNVENFLRENFFEFEV